LSYQDDCSKPSAFLTRKVAPDVCPALHEDSERVFNVWDLGVVIVALWLVLILSSRYAAKNVLWLVRVLNPA